MLQCKFLNSFGSHLQRDDFRYTKMFVNANFWRELFRAPGEMILVTEIDINANVLIKCFRTSGEAIWGTLKYLSMQSPLSKHCIEALYQSHLSKPFINTLYQSTLSKSFITALLSKLSIIFFFTTARLFKALYQNTVSKLFIKTLRWKSFTQTFYSLRNILKH